MNKNIVILLKAIESGGGVIMLVRNGISYKDIATITNDCIEKGFVSYAGGNISLTEEGKSFLEKNRDKIKNSNKQKWIDPEIRSRVPRIDRDFVFLPSKKELSFQRR